MKEFNFDTTPIVDVVNDIIIDAVTKNASDIHFDPAENYLKIRIRIDGELRDYSIIPNKYKRNLITRVKLLAGMNITESRLPQDGAIKSNINGKDLDLRVASLPTSFGEKVVIRILDYSMSFEGIESLGFSNENYETILEMLANPNGIILVTGATGSGKSTTVYSMLQRLNKEDTNIITVEDPVEMNIEGINQVQVNSEIGLDFATVLRSILREDPNIILIGEIRDSETAQIAIRASITGHLVLSTVHTNNSLTTIERLLDMNVERYLLSASLKGIISQNLAKKLCPTCKKERPTTPAEKRIFKKSLGMDVEKIYDAVGCPSCRNGYRGRIALQEVLLINDEIRDAISERAPREKLREMIYKKDVKTLLQDGLLKVINGTTTIEEVFRLVDAENDNDNIFAKDKEEIVKRSLANKEENQKLAKITPVNVHNFNEEKIMNNNTIENNINLNNNNNEFNLDNIINEPINNDINNNIINTNSNIEKSNDLNTNNIINDPTFNTNIYTAEDNNTFDNYNENNNNNVNDIVNISNNEFNLDNIINEPINNNDINNNIINTNNTIEKSNEITTNNEIEQPITNTNTDNNNEIINEDKNTTGNYTEDLINLINQGFFE